MSGIDAATAKKNLSSELWNAGVPSYSSIADAIDDLIKAHVAEAFERAANFGAVKHLLGESL